MRRFKINHMPDEKKIPSLFFLNLDSQWKKLKPVPYLLRLKINWSIAEKKSFLRMLGEKRLGRKVMK